MKASENRISDLATKLEEKRKSDCVVETTRATRNCDIESFFEEEGIEIDELQLKKLYYAMEYTILESLGDWIIVNPIYTDKEVASTLANKAFYNFKKTLPTR